MKLKISIIIVLFGCGQGKQSELNLNDNSYLIEATELLDIANHPNIKIVDFRKKEPYLTEHIANAVNICRADIEDPSFNYKGMMASQSQMESLLGGLGIAVEDTIVIYDDNGLCNASRLWWILQNYDFQNIKLLHGGIEAWKKAGGKLTNEVPKLKSRSFILPKNPSMKYHCAIEDVKSALNGENTIIDTRTDDEFSGKRQKKGALKSGRIPGGRHIDWAQAIDYDGNKRLKSLEDLQSIYSDITHSQDQPIIIYCHTGMRSAHTTFVLTQLLGYENVKNYDGSWTEWTQFSELPLESDSITTVF